MDDEVEEVIVVEPDDEEGIGGTPGKDGRGKISAVGTGRVLKSRSASVMRARIFSIPRERAVAAIAALFAGVSSVTGAGIGFGNTIGGCVNAGC